MLTTKDMLRARDKARRRAEKKAMKGRLEAEEAAACALLARLRLHKDFQSDQMVRIAKHVADGIPTKLTKREFYLELQKRAEETRQPCETRESAFARYATTDTDGRLLMQAHRAAGGEDYSGEPDADDDEPLTNEAFRRLMDLAAEKRKKGETVEQAFARVHADPKYRDLVTTERRMHNARVAKAMGAG